MTRTDIRRSLTSIRKTGKQLFRARRLGKCFPVLWALKGKKQEQSTVDAGPELIVIDGPQQKVCQGRMMRQTGVN
jgi:hypothetical protein